MAGPEFGSELQGRIIFVVKSLYGLTISTARWHEDLSRTLTKMGFEPTRADADLWMKDCGTHYEYICTWVDDVICASKDPEAILNALRTTANYTLKGVGEPTYYLGGNFGRIKTDLLPGKDSTSYLSAQKYIEEVCDKIEKVLEVKL